MSKCANAALRRSSLSSLLWLMVAARNSCVNDCQT